MIQAAFPVIYPVNTRPLIIRAKNSRQHLIMRDNRFVETEEPGTLDPILARIHSGNRIIQVVRSLGAPFFRL